jgi:ABC-type lipoprotein release transport system permease subunit
VDNLDELGGLPWVVDTFLALVALVVTVHALFSAIRVWRRDLGVLRTLGFVPAQVRAAVRWQALTTAALGFAFGLPLGLAIARLAWSEVATALGVVDERVIPWPALAVVIVLLPAVAILLALPPGRVAARARVAEALRAE